MKKHHENFAAPGAVEMLLLLLSSTCACGTKPTAAEIKMCSPRALRGSKFRNCVVIPLDC